MFLRTEEDFDNYNEDQIASFSGYEYSITYSKSDYESASHGMPLEEGFITEKEIVETLYECLLDDFRGGSLSSTLDHRGFTPSMWVSCSMGETRDKIYHGIEEERSLHIKRADGKQFCKEESEYIISRLNLR